MISTLPRRHLSVLLFRFDYTWPKFLPAVPTVNPPPKSFLPMRERCHRLGGWSRELPVRVAVAKYAGNRRPHGWSPRNFGRAFRIQRGRDQSRSAGKKIPKLFLAARHLSDIAQLIVHRTAARGWPSFLAALSKARSGSHGPS